MRYEDWGVEEFGLTKRGRLVGQEPWTGYQYGYEASAVCYARQRGCDVPTSPFPGYDPDYEYVEDTSLDYTWDNVPLVRSGKTKRRASEMSSSDLWAECERQYSDAVDECQAFDRVGQTSRKRQDRGMTPTWDDLVAFANRDTCGSVRSVTDELGSLWMDSTADDVLFAGMLLSVG
jgi:hypothetical protein